MLRGNYLIAKVLVTQAQETGPLSIIRFLANSNCFVHILSLLFHDRAGFSCKSGFAGATTYKDVTSSCLDSNSMVLIHAYSSGYKPIPNISVAMVAMLWDQQARR
jgi:hypothetical protein